MLSRTIPIYLHAIPTMKLPCSFSEDTGCQPSNYDVAIRTSSSGRHRILQKTAGEHIRRVLIVLSLLNIAYFALNLKNYQFSLESIAYLVYLIHPGHLKIAPRIKDTIDGLQYPSNVTEIQFVLGQCNVLRRFVRIFAGLVNPLKKIR